MKKRKNPNRNIIILLSMVVLALALTAVIIFVFSARLDKGKDTPSQSTGAKSRVHVLYDEMRGVWVPTVYNLTYPSTADLSEDALKVEIDQILTKCESVGLNTVMFQVRPCCDALYRSDIYPVSKYLSSDGTLNLDCLDYLVKEAHERKISVFAWINPLRASVDKMTVEEFASSFPAAAEWSKWIISYGEKLYFDPAYAEVRRLVCDGVAEIVRNYEVDGIIFDEYFYPYKVYETDEAGNRVIAVFDDEENYEAFGQGYESVDDFRRANTNKLVKEVFTTVKAIDTECQFGVAPFGIWQNDNGSNGGSKTSGLESYSELYCDTLAWIESGTVDFLAPQLYWQNSSKAASFSALARWWNEKVDGSNVKLYFTHAAYRYDKSDFAPGEITEQMKSAAELENYSGSVFYSYAAFRDDLAGICEEIRTYYER